MFSMMGDSESLCVLHMSATRMLNTVSFCSTLHRKLRGEALPLRVCTDDVVARCFARYAFSSCELDTVVVRCETGREGFSPFAELTCTWTMDEAD